MTIKLSDKEKRLLEDQKKHENLCIQKYQSYARIAQDPQLKQLFNSYAQQEQQHYDTINQLLNGQIPNMNQQGQQTITPQSGNTASQMGTGSSEASLCDDMLMAEKYVSGAYDTAIFEFEDANIRQTLNHIQKEEQQHGEGLYNYMKSKGIYNQS